MVQQIDVSVTFQPVKPADRPFLRLLYDDTREQELALTDWTEDQKRHFLDMQFAAQLNHYEEHFPNAQHHIIMLHDEPIGRLYVERRDFEIRLLDITLAPAARNHGLGSQLIRDLLSEGRTKSVPVRLYVWEGNQAAYRLYRRLGFSDVEKQSVYIFMECCPN